MDWSISDISWIHQPNPGEYGLKAQQAGAATAHNFLQGMQMGQENSRENALMPLKQQQMQAQLQSAALDVQMNQTKMADYLTNKQGFSELTKAVSEFPMNGGWSNPENERRYWEMGSRFPGMVMTPEYQNIGRQFEVAGATAIKAKEADARAIRAEAELKYNQDRILVERAKIDSRENMADDENTNRLVQTVLDNQMKQYVADQGNETKLSTAANKPSASNDKIWQSQLDEIEVKQKGVLNVYQSGMKNAFSPGEKAKVQRNYNETIESLDVQSAKIRSDWKLERSGNSGSANAEDGGVFIDKITGKKYTRKNGKYVPVGN